MKEFRIWIYIGLAAMVIAGLFLFRDNMVNYVSKQIKGQLPVSEKQVLENEIYKKYNYDNNGKNYNYTFLEFGSSGCLSCIKMESVMEEIRTEFAGRVNVVFVDVALPENKELADFFGIAMIPTQVLLDRNGKEFYRHNGFISSDDLKIHFK